MSHTHLTARLLRTAPDESQREFCGVTSAPNVVPGPPRRPPGRRSSPAAGAGGPRRRRRLADVVHARPARHQATAETFLAVPTLRDSTVRPPSSALSHAIWRPSIPASLHSPAPLHSPRLAGRRPAASGPKADRSRARSRVDCDPQGAVGGGGAPRPTIPSDHQSNTGQTARQGLPSTENGAPGAGPPTQQPSTQRPAPGTERRAPSIEHRAPGTGHGAPGTEHRAPSTKHQAPSTKHRAPSIEHRASSTKHRAPGTGHQAPGTKHQHQAPGTKHRARRPQQRRRRAANRGRRHVDPRPEATEAHTRHVRGPRHPPLDASRHRAVDPPLAPHHRLPHAPGHPSPARVWSPVPRAFRRLPHGGRRRPEAGPARPVPQRSAHRLPTAPGARRPPSRRVTRCRPGPGLRGRRPASRREPARAGRGAASRRVRRRRFGPLFVRERAHAGDGGRSSHPRAAGGIRHHNKIPPPTTLSQDALRRPDQDAREAGPVRDRPLVGS